MGQLATEIKELGPVHFVGIRTRVSDPFGGPSKEPGVEPCIGDFCTKALPATFGTAMGAGVQPMSMPFCIYFEHDEKAHVFDMLAGLQVSESDAAKLAGTETPAGQMTSGQLPASKVLRHIHKGPYEQLPQVWEQLLSQMHQAGMQSKMPCWEQYLNDPGQVPADQLLTEINIPVE